MALNLGNLFSGLGQFDPNMTPDQVDTRRLLIASMLSQGRQADSVGEGVVALAGGLLGGMQRRKLDGIETTNRQKATDAFNSAMGGWSPFTMGSDTLTGSAGGDTLGGDIGGYAEAIAGNESGGNYQAVGPVTKSGDRAYGKYQVMGANVGPWTEKYVGRRMTPQEFMADPAAQDAVFRGEFGSYVQQYGNPQDAASMWFSGKPLAQAGNASDGYMTVPDYVSKFTGQLGGGQMTGSGGSNGLTGQAGGDMLGGNSAGIYQALANPWLSQEQRAALMGLLEQNDPLRQLQLREAQLRVQAMENPAQEPGYRTATPEEAQAFGAPAGQFGPDGKFYPLGPDAPLVSVDMGNNQASPWGEPPKDHVWLRDANGQIVTQPDASGRGVVPVATPIIGGPNDTTASTEKAAGMASAASDVITTAATRALDAFAGLNLGPGATRVAGLLPWTDSAEVWRQVDVLRSNATIQNLQAMREASPTGGALGSVTEKENKMLADKAGALDPDSPNFKRDLADYTRTLLRIVHGPDVGDVLFEEWAKSATGAKPKQPVAAPQDDPLGLFGN